MILSKANFVPNLEMDVVVTFWKTRSVPAGNSLPLRLTTPENTPMENMAEKLKSQRRERTIPCLGASKDVLFTKESLTIQSSLACSSDYSSLQPSLPFVHNHPLKERAEN